LTKTGPGTLTLTGANSSTAQWTVAAGTLNGTGSIAAPVLVLSGGTLGAGGPSAVGALTISNTLTLGDGSTTTLRLNQAAATHDSVAGVTTLTYGGALTVTNLAGTPAAGNSFQLFNATTYTGNFEATNLPALASGLAWNWTPTNGTLAVGYAKPTITGFGELSNGRFSLTFTGALGASYTVYATTNLALPLSSWTVMTNSSFNGAPVTFQDAKATNYPARFYQVALP